MKIEISSIAVEERLRPVNSNTVSMLADSIKTGGLKEPIQVRESENGYILIDGNHRLNAYKQLERNKIEAIIQTFEGTTDEIARKSSLAELDANLATESLSEQHRHFHIYTRLNLMIEIEMAEIPRTDPQYDKKQKSVTKEACKHLINNKWAKDQAYINSAVNACNALKKQNVHTQELDTRTYRKVVSAAKSATRLSEREKRSSDEETKLVNIKNKLSQSDLAEVFGAKFVKATTPKIKKSKLEIAQEIFEQLDEQEKKLFLETNTVKE